MCTNSKDLSPTEQVESKLKLSLLMKRFITKFLKETDYTIISSIESNSHTNLQVVEIDKQKFEDWFVDKKYYTSGEFNEIYDEFNTMRKFKKIYIVLENHSLRMHEKIVVKYAFDGENFNHSR